MWLDNAYMTIVDKSLILNSENNFNDSTEDNVYVPYVNGHFSFGKQEVVNGMKATL